MAKRKRLQPAAERAPETKAALGWVGHGRRHVPIADVTGDSAQQSALEEVAQELRSAREEGRMVLRLPLSAVVVEHLVRDRIDAGSEEMSVLMDSLRDRGQQTPIEVVDLGAGRYGLISGWRRITALQALQVEDPGRFGHVQALIRAPETASDAYRAMVEENEIRADLSFYERARIAVLASQQGVYPDPKAAVQALFAAARAPKRSKIVSFTEVVAALDGVLRFPTAIPEKLGLPLAAALQDKPGFGRQLAERLHKADAQDAAAERAVLEHALTNAKPKPQRKRQSVAPGISVEQSRGRVVLSGQGVDAALLRDLRDWLAARNK